MNKTKKQLEEQLVELRQEKENYQSKYWDLKSAEDTRKKNEMFAIKSENDELANQVRNLLEIIRWQMRPNTAESPFKPTKEQRDSRRVND